MDNKLLSEGLAYLEKLENVNPATSRLGNEVLFNFVSIGIETVLTAVLMNYNRMVDHSGILRLLRELEKIEPVNQSWIDTARFLNRFQSYCSLEPIPVSIPDKSDLIRILDFGKDIQRYGVSKLSSI